MISRVLVAFVVMLSSLEADAAGMRVEFAVSRTGTLTHHILCLASAVQCGKEYDKLWMTLGGLSADDRKLLDDVRQVDHSLRRRRFGEDWTTQASVFPFPKRDKDGHMRFRGEADGSPSVDDLIGKAKTWMTPDEVKVIDKAWHGFEQRFATHWVKAGPALEAKKAALQTQAPAITAFMVGVHRFMQSDWPAEKAFVVYLVDRPNDGRTSHAEWLGDLAVLEVSEVDLAVDLLRITAVEGVRALYANAPLATHRSRQRALSSLETDALLPAYGLLDDALAYALTDALLLPQLKEKPRTRPPELVGRIAAALTPMLAADFNDHVLDGTATKKYVAEIARREEVELSAPRHALRFVDVAFDRPLTDARRELTRVLGAERVNGYSPMDAPDVITRFAEKRGSFVSVVWLAKPDDLARLAKHAAYFDEATLFLIQKYAKTTTSFAWGIKRDVASPAYLFVAPSTEDFRKVFEHFRDAKKAFTGPQPQK